MFFKRILILLGPKYWVTWSPHHINFFSKHKHFGNIGKIIWFWPTFHKEHRVKYDETRRYSMSMFVKTEGKDREITVIGLYSANNYYVFGKFLLTFSWRRSLPYRNQSIDLQSKLMDWFLYNNGLRHERVKRIPLG